MPVGMPEGNMPPAPSMPGMPPPMNGGIALVGGWPIMPPPIIAPPWPIIAGMPC